jgi:hypothetical protein
MVRGNLWALLRERPDVFIGRDLTWYADERDLQIRSTPGVMVVFGRPRRDRTAYRQWEEGNVPVTVTFDVVFPESSIHDVLDKLDLCRDYGSEECYFYDPDKNRLDAFLGKRLRHAATANGLVSPRLGISRSGPRSGPVHARCNGISRSGLFGLAVLLQPVGVDQPGCVIVGAFQDGLEQALAVGGHEAPP